MMRSAVGRKAEDELERAGVSISLAGPADDQGIILPAKPKIICGKDHRWLSKTRIELATGSADQDFMGLGSSPWLGDFSGSAVRIPNAPTVDQSHRYLVRFCGLEIPMGKGIIIRGVRQLLTIRSEFANAVGFTYVFEREQISPLWHFIDGNVSWHLRWQSNIQSNFHPPFAIGADQNTENFDSAMLSLQQTPYIPVASGIPGGTDVDYLGTWRDIRYPWSNTSWDLSVPVIGPGCVMFYASIHQTNNNTTTGRPQPPALVAPAPFLEPITVGLRPEDAFLLQFPNCNYGHIAGALLVELYPNVESMS